MNRQMEVLSVTKHFHPTKASFLAIKDVTFHVNEGQFICIVGPSGCGKSTLLKMIAGLEKPSSGEIRFEGNPVTSPHHKISMVFQSFALFPWRTVIENVEYGLELKKLHKKDRGKVARECLEIVGLSGYEKMYPKQLSGGMKQRVGIARALAVDPEVILMDEAFSAVDEFTAETLREEVSEIHMETKKTFILVTHNVAEAIELSDKIIVLSARPGSVKDIIDVELNRPRDKNHSGFIHIHKRLFSLLKEELESTIVRHKIKEIHEFHRLHNIE